MVLIISKIKFSRLIGLKHLMIKWLVEVVDSLVKAHGSVRFLGAATPKVEVLEGHRLNLNCARGAEVEVCKLI